MKELSFFLFFLFTSVLVFSQDQKRLAVYNLQNGIAVQGYDVVAYFKQGKAVKGIAANSVYHQGVKYQFANAANKDEFKSNPSKYEPQYGGWCAYAMGATGEKVEVDPETFKIINGQLYLFYNKLFNNTLKTWNKDETNLKARANANWGKIY